MLPFTLQHRYHNNCLSNLHTVLENRPYHAISEQAVQKLVDTLDDLQKMIEKHNKTSMKSKTKRFILGDSNVAKIQRMYWALRTVLSVLAKLFF